MGKQIHFKPLVWSVFCIGLWLLVCPLNGFTLTDSMPSAVIRLPENENAILVEKKTQTLFLYSSNDTGLFVKFQVPCSTGEASGVKQEAGDRKTPEGIYFLTDEYEDRYLSPIYGQKAFPTDYPNFIDKREGKNGSAIWIHGTNKELRPMDSNGCVALENDNIVKLSDLVVLHSTPVIMVEEIENTAPSMLARQDREINQVLDQWSGALEKGNYHDYLGFYSDTYLPDISWWEDWLKVRGKEGIPDAGIRTEREKTGIYHHNGVFVVLFDHFLVLGEKKINLGKRKLFLEDGGYKIIGDVFQAVSKAYQDGSTPLIAAALSLAQPVFDSKAVVEMVKEWLAAWSAKDMERYGAFYADNFYSDGMNKSRWVNRKKALSKKYDYIKITGKRFEVTEGKSTCEVSFYQEYESSGFTTQGTKRLKLVNKGGLWKIYRESWKER